MNQDRGSKQPLLAGCHRGDPYAVADDRTPAYPLHPGVIRDAAIAGGPEAVGCESYADPPRMQMPEPEA